MEEFWINNPKIIFKRSELTKIWPYEDMSFEEKLNAATRFILLITIVGYVLMNNYTILLLGLIMVLLVVLTYNLYKKEVSKEGMQSYTELEKINNIDFKNPMNNVMLNEYTDNPTRVAASKYSKNVEDKINKETKNFIMENNKENKDIDKLFNNLGDNLEFEKSMRQFYINPSTTIPNGQKEFLEYCYGNLYTEKPLIVH